MATSQQPRLLINLCGSNIHKNKNKKKKDALSAVPGLEQVRSSILDDIAKFQQETSSEKKHKVNKKQLASVYVEASRKRAKLDELELRTSSCVKKLCDSARTMKDMGFSKESSAIEDAIHKIDYDGSLKKKFNVEDSMKQMEDTLIENNMAEICCICQSYAVSYGNNIAVLKCGHVYHLKCIVQNAYSRKRNFNSSAPCPQCREEVGLIKDVDCSSFSSSGRTYPTFASLTRTLSDDPPDFVSSSDPSYVPFDILSS